MSLKAFHIVFIIASVLLALGIGAWCLNNYLADGVRRDLVGAIVSVLAAIGMVVYGIYFLKKLKKLDYL